MSQPNNEEQHTNFPHMMYPPPSSLPPPSALPPTSSLPPPYPVQAYPYPFPVQQPHQYPYPIQYPAAYPYVIAPPSSTPLQEVPLGPVVPGQPKGYAVLEQGEDNATPVQYSLKEQMKVLPWHMLFALTGQVAKLRIAKNYASGRLVLLLYLFFFGYEVVFQFFTPFGLGPFIPFLFVLCFFIQTGIFGMLGYCMHGPRISQEAFLQFCYVTVLFGIPVFVLQVLLVFPSTVVFFIMLALMAYSIILYIFALQAVYDVTPCKAVTVVLIYLLVVCAIVGFLIYAIAQALSNMD